MQTKNNTNEAAPEASQESPVPEMGIMELFQKIEKLLARGNSLSLALLKELHSIDTSLAILAGQKKRELDGE